MTKKKDKEENEECKFCDTNPIIYIVVGLLVGALVTYAYLGAIAPPVTDTTNDSGVDIPTGTKVDGNELATKAITYLNEQFLAEQGLEATFKNLTETESFYEIGFTIYSSGQPVQDFTMYATKNGEKLILGDTFDISGYVPGQKEEPEFEAKTDAPLVEFYIMSFCPYGNQAEEGLGPVVELLDEHATFEPHFVVYSDFCSGGQRCNPDDYCIGDYCAMHGINELNENVRQACVWKYQENKWWDYVNYANANCNVNNIETCWLDAAENSGVDTTAVQTCFDSETETILAAEYAAMAKYGVQGSPQIFINGVEHSGGRSPENYKSAVCDAFNEPPETCGATLDESASATTGSCG